MAEILNLDEGNILLLPSPIKTRSPRRQKVHPSTTTHPGNGHTNSNIRRPLFRPINQDQNNQLVEVPDLENIIIESNSLDNAFELNINENEASNNFEFTAPIWSKNNVFSQKTLPEFTCTDGPSSLINTEDDHTPFSTKLWTALSKK